MTEERTIDLELGRISSLAREAVGFIEGMDKQRFLADRRTQQAVAMNLIIIGEIVSKLLSKHADLEDRHPDIPWRSMRGMRNRIAHGYFQLDLEVVWLTVQTALSDLDHKITSIRPLQE
jgi:uncharacterized protein with HEPN domain